MNISPFSFPLQIREPLRHVDNGLTSRGAVVAGNSSHGRQRAECQPSNEVGPADRPCVFAITLVGKGEAGRYSLRVSGGGRGDCGH